MTTHDLQAYLGVTIYIDISAILMHPLVTADAVTADNTDGRVQFDDTPAVFDLDL